MCSIFDAAAKGEQLDTRIVVRDAAVSFALGFISSLSEAKALETAVNVFETGYSFVTTLNRGGTFEEATVNAAETYVTNKLAGKAGKSVAGGAKKDIANSAGENIASGFVTMCTSALTKVGRGIWNMFFGTRNNPAVNPHREVRIHAFGG